MNKASGHHRRGNALILVAGILVLLVIMATVFLSRTSTLRELGTAERQSAFHRDRRDSAANEIAQEVADSLFVRPIDFTSAEYGLGLPPDEQRRLTSDSAAPRYGVDPEFTWNRAPWEVVPWTNPPDWLTWPLRPGKLREMSEESSNNQPDVAWEDWQWWEDRADNGGGPGNAGGGLDLFQWPDAWEAWPPDEVAPSQPESHLRDVVLQPRENPLGGPGVSDTRWLRDIEPQRMPVGMLNDPSNDFGTVSIANPWSDRAADAYSHWRHMSWIGRPGNTWRMCPDIADVTGVRTLNRGTAAWTSTMTDDGIRHANGAWVDGRRYYGGIYDRMDVPIEQWPAMTPTAPLDIAPQQNRFWPDGVKARLTDPEELSFGDSATSVFVPENDDVVMLGNPVDMSTIQGDDHLLDFWDRWLAWLRPEGYKQALIAARGGNGNLIPPNFYDLDDLDGDGKRGEYYDPKTFPDDDDYDPDEDSRWGETPMDEFRPDTARWHVSRILTDTDGDGFTDSFWWLSPHVGVDGTRQVIGVSVTDNSGRLNANVATRFVKADQAAMSESTRGWTPSDLAMVSQNYGPLGGDQYTPTHTPVWNTGFLDIEPHQPGLLENNWDSSQDSLVGQASALGVPFVTYPGDGAGSGNGFSESYPVWNSNYWRSTSNRAILEALNVDAGGAPNPFFPDTYPYDISDRDNRLYYFQQSGQDPQQPGNVFTPFNLAEELELRAYEGNNHGWVYSRLERALGPSDAYLSGDSHVLRGTFGRQEASEAGEQLDNRQLAHDLRHRMTLFNGARNETLPPHLWWAHRAPAPRADDIVVGGDLTPGSLERVPSSEVRVEDMHQRFQEQMREKIDLREWERAARSQLASNTAYDPRTFSERLSKSLLLGLTSGDVTDHDDPDNSLVDPVIGTIIVPRGGRDSYYGQGDEAWERTRRMAAALTANMLASRDPDQDAPLLTMEGVLPPDNAADPPFLGAPTRDNWHGEFGAVPLPFFEGAYYPADLGDVVYEHDDNDGSIVFPGGETVGVGGSTSADQLLGNLSFGGSGESNMVSDYLDLSDINMPRELLPDPSYPSGHPASEALQPWDMVCVGIDSDGDGWADWSEKRPWATAGGDRVVGRLRNITDDLNFVCPDLLAFRHPDMNTEFEPVPAWTESYAPEVHMLGMEPQPFISEVFFAEVAKAWRIGEVQTSGTGSTTIVRNFGGALWVTRPVDSTHELATSQDAQNEVVQPDPSRVVFAVQLVNPYDVPLPLMERGPSGILRPLYSLRVLRANRFDPTLPAKWEIPLDPTMVSMDLANPDANQLQLFRTSTSYDGATHRPDGTVPDFILDDETGVPMLPPATNDRPYSLTIVLNGVENLGGNSLEDIRWLDFLDFEPDRHPSLDLVTEPNGLQRTIQPGELLWRLDPAAATQVLGADMTDPRQWYHVATAFPSESSPPVYAPPVSGGSAGGPLDPRTASTVELVRIHRRPWSEFSTGSTPPSQDDLVNFDYQAKVVIDRTVDADGVDELAHVITMQLAAYRLPAISMVAPWSTIPGEDMPDTVALPATVGVDDLDGATASSWTNFSIRFPRMLQSDYGLERIGGVIQPLVQDNPTKKAGYAKLRDPSTSAQRQELLVEPENARWMQWARYGRAWAVDDHASTSDMEPLLADVVEADRKLWRPDRAAPRFVAADGRVTMSWSPAWAGKLGLMPDLDSSYSHQEELAFPQYSYPVLEGGQSATRRIEQATWLAEGIVNGGSGSGGSSLELGQHPILVDTNLPSFGPERGIFDSDPSGADLDWLQPPTRLMRRWSEQKMGGAPQRTPADSSLAGRIGMWDTWQVDDDGNTRTIHVFVNGDPANDWDRDNDGNPEPFDQRLPANLLLTANNPSDMPLSPVPGSIPTEWELFWQRTHGSNVYGREGFELHDTYANALRFRNGHIYDANWDPDGLGRRDTNGDGFMDDGSATLGYTVENPYPYPWATRNVRLPWSHQNDVTDDEYYLFQSHKPHFFSFNPQRNVNGVIVNLDAGYEPGDTSNPMPWSYPDKGYYGPAEIDGDILMPFGYQVQLKDANFEQVGEVLEVPTIAHELYVPLEASSSGITHSWPADYYSDWPAIPDIAALNTAGELPTTRTYSEQLAEELASGAGVSAGHLQLRGTSNGLNAIVGDPRTTHEVIGGQLVTYTPYDLKLGRRAVPDWYLWSDDVAHLDPDLPATQRLLDMFVCDGPGIHDLVRSDPDRLDQYDTIGSDGFIDDPEDWQLFADPWNGQLSVRSSSFDNAGGFEGRPTRGLVNINTAPVEVLRTLPHLYRMVHADPHSDETPLLDNFSVDDLELERPFSPHPRTAVPEAIVQFRDGLGQLPRYDQENQFDPLNEPPLGAFDSSLVTGVPDAAPYSDRGVGLPRDWWGVDQFPNTGDDLIADLDVTYSSNLKNRYNNPAFADVDADETIRFSRGTRGFAGIGELFQLSRPAFYDYGFIDEDGDGVEDGDYREPLGTSVAADAWRMDWSGRNPFGYQDKQVHGENGTLSGGSTLWDDRSDVDSDDNRLRDAMSHPGAFLSTDTDRSFDTQVPELSNFEHVASWPAGLQWVDPLGGYGGFQHAGTDDPRYRELHLTGDRVAGDAEEQSLLFSGISNMITTRSDVFTVHLRVRTFKRNPESGVWDATDRDQIVDDARYVMVVDRSEVDRPGDRPRILMLQRIDD